LAPATWCRVALVVSVLVGELGLDGRVREVRGVLPALLAARSRFRDGHRPAGQVAEAQLVLGSRFGGSVAWRSDRGPARLRCWGRAEPAPADRGRAPTLPTWPMCGSTGGCWAMRWPRPEDTTSSCTVRRSGQVDAG
jgi:hypothetical protein